MALPAHSGPWPLIQFRNHFSRTIGLLGRVFNPSQGLYLNTGQHKHRISAYTYQTSMPWVGFEPTVPASEREKRVHDFDRAATVTGFEGTYCFHLQSWKKAEQAEIVCCWFTCSTFHWILKVVINSEILGNFYEIIYCHILHYSPLNFKLIKIQYLQILQITYVVVIALLNNPRIKQEVWMR
jgi:hypothetical protein